MVVSQLHSTRDRQAVSTFLPDSILRNLFYLTCVILTSFFGCGQQNKVIEAEAQVVADAFTDGDMKTINRTIFGTNEVEIDDGLSDLWGEDAQYQDGVLACIFDLVTVKVKKTTDSTIEYEIEAPDMSKVFIDMNTNVDNISEDGLLDYIKSYVPNAETKETTVSLEYILVDDEPIVNYQNEEFINAVTGGLLDAYKNLYSEMLEEYTEGVD